MLVQIRKADENKKKAERERGWSNSQILCLLALIRPGLFLLSNGELYNQKKNNITLIPFAGWLNIDPDTDN